MAGVTKKNILLAANVRSLALEKIKAVLEGDDEEFKKALLLKLSGSILPRLNEHTGADGEPLVIQFDKAFKDATTPETETDRPE